MADEALERARRTLGSDPEKAVGILDRALKKNHGGAERRALRAELLGRLGRTRDALRDVDAAIAALPTRGEWRLLRGRLLLAAGRPAEAALEFRRASQAGAPGSAVLFEMARAALAARRPADARKAFAALARVGAGGGCAQEARLLSAWSVWEEQASPLSASRRVAGGEFFICGGGIEPADMTLGTLAALRGCRVVYTHWDQRSLRAVLECLGAPVKVLRLPISKPDWNRLLARLGRELDAGDVGFVAYGHPLVFNTYALDFAAWCRSTGRRLRIIPAISAVDRVITSLWPEIKIDVAGGFAMLHARSITEDGGGFFPERPTLVYYFPDVARSGGLSRFCSALEKAYPPEHPVLGVRCCDALNLESRHALMVASLRERAAELPETATLFLPPLKAAGRGRKSRHT